MTFAEITRVMLGNMDFFQLRNVADKYGVAYRGIRRQKLLKEVEKVIVAKSMNSDAALVAKAPQGATSARPDLKSVGAVGSRSKKAPLGINTFSARNSSL
ncbi:MAG: hypothetical protein R3A45_12985 [Bdellovibrionota bacterium]|nr:hypothetical protein [Deltaproteobacteria bacterium]